MAKMPPLRRITAEDFKEQASWIEKLIQPINSYFEANSQALNKGLTIGDNFAGAIKTVELNGVFPLAVTWGLALRPVSVLVGNVQRSDGSPTYTVATVAGTLTSGSNVITGVSSTSGIHYDHLVAGTGIPTNTRVVSISGTSITLSANATAAGSQTLSFSVCEAVQVQWSFNQNGQLQIDGVTGITPTQLTKYLVTLECKAG